ncbi:hypothetical protein GCM10020331_065920 [Ectobacillus funiculus]
MSCKYIARYKKFTEGSVITGASLIGGADIKRQVERLKKASTGDHWLSGPGAGTDSYEEIENA